MPGSNLYVYRKHQAAFRSALPVVYLRNCVFISHKREDSEMAQEVADALTSFDINVWLDLTELGFDEPSTDEEHIRLTHAIEAGLRNSTHLLALITPNTQGSWWVPFEIGSSRAMSKKLAFLLHRDVRQTPSYFALGHGIETKHQLFDWAEEISPTDGRNVNRAALASLRASPLDKFVELILERK